MQTSGPTSGIPPISTSSVPATTAQWQIGQLLHATVTENNIGKVLLAIGNRQISAETSLPLQKGQQLTLEVRSLGAQPVLRVFAAVSESLSAAAVRLLLPKQGPFTPLLANINRLAQSPNPPVPPLIHQLARDMVAQMPEKTAVSNAIELKKAIENSGVFLEKRLLQHAGQGNGLTLNTDFKANLLRLVQLVRNWPGSAQTAPAPPSPSPQPSAPGTTGQPSAQAATPQGIPPAQLGRVVLTASSVATAPATTPATSGGLVMPGTASTPGIAGQPPAALPGTLLPPPLPGAVPVPQAVAAANLEILNRLGNLRTDLLQQVEAALARTQLQQLAALPREGGERALLEWLLELPVRNGDAINLWSLRIFREPQNAHRPTRKQTNNWTVQIAVDLPGLGPMQIQIRLADEQISTRFWATREDTLPLLRDHLHELRQSLRDAGLEVGELDCQNGSAPAGKTRGGEPLISEKA